ncbi:MAG: endonuclease/exonuclease/phosphatase family protein [Pyrinomonadaceae bacterium]
MVTKRNIAAAFLFAAYFCIGCFPAYADKNRDVKVMTYNMYLGSDFSEIFTAQTPDRLVTEVGEAYTDMQMGNVPERITAIADQIEAGAPVLVGLQEVALWRIGAPFDPAPATFVTYDFLQMLLEELKARGMHYAPIAVQTNLDAELPGVFSPTAALDIRFTDRVVILARTDLRTSEFKLERTQTQTFATILPVTSPTLGTIFIPRGWASADVKLRGKKYRFISAHLESFFDPVQFAQAAELLQGPTNTDVPVILSGDFNSDAAANAFTYQMLTGSGFSDIWIAASLGGPGLTWPLSGEIPSAITAPSQRLDLILTRGAVSIADADILGEAAADLTPSGFRPSDHAGVIATVVLEP